jgi:lipopolysaccharide transport system permease protein
MDAPAATRVGAHSAPVELVIRPPGRWQGLGLRELWQYRELLYFLTKRELQVRYKQSFVGIGWAILQPLAMTFIFALFFGRIARIPSEGIPYPVFALTAVVPWVFFSQAVTQSSPSLVADANLVSKVYFPRAVIPMAKVLSLLVDLTFALLTLAGLAYVYGVGLEPTAPLATPFLALALATAFGVGLFFAGLNVRYRDVAVGLPLVVQLWLFASPVVYPSSLIGGAWQYVYSINPVVSVIDGIRWAVLGTPAPQLGAVAISVASASLIVAGAVVYFRRTERSFADII